MPNKSDDMKYTLFRFKRANGALNELGRCLAGRSRDLFRCHDCRCVN